ncbi:MAG: hypothetical protein JXA54_15580 [Candidatus Heimdallarchaeota archaeon]|nr:hypothetical protein [Candidatus Heimdallarchaeota archaeon]
MSTRNSKVNGYVIPLTQMIKPQTGLRNDCVVISCPHCMKILGTYDTWT